ncbi:MAG: cell wall-active antibiotics response protein [candidate division KSB1 bacterium]|nr:cell wall-active antibiotics response protein [candidate division KSB1 bacterium]
MKRLTLSILVIIVLVSFQTLQAQRYQQERLEKSFDIPRDKTLQVRLDVDVGEVVVEKNPKSNNAFVSILYTRDEFDADVDYDKKDSELRIYFDKRGFDFDRDKNRKMEARVEVRLPTEPEIEFYTKVKAGEIDMDLGGLRLKNFTLKTWAGETDLDFSEPNLVEMEYLEVNLKVGESRLNNLGNAKFKEADINGGIGELTVDFSGESIQPARVRIDLDIGETTIILPRKVGVKMSVSKFLFLTEVDIPEGFRRSGRYYYSENYDKSAEGLYLKINQGIGELRFE